MADSNEESLTKLMKLTKLIKTEKINVKEKEKGFQRGGNKWRSKDPKFSDKKKAEGTVEAGGMQVDPARAAEYEAWRKDKEEEQKYRRELADRKARREKQDQQGEGI